MLVFPWDMEMEHLHHKQLIPLVLALYHTMSLLQIVTMIIYLTLLQLIKVSEQVVILYGYGNGSFELSRRYSTGFGSKPFGIVTADLDNDTHLEFVVALYGTGDIAILTEYYAAEFVNKTIYSTGSAPQPTSVAIGDFNNDNRSDIVVANSGRDSLGILLASSNGTFGIEMNVSH